MDWSTFKNRTTVGPRVTNENSNLTSNYIVELKKTAKARCGSPIHLHGLGYFNPVGRSKNFTFRFDSTTLISDQSNDLTIDHTDRVWVAALKGISWSIRKTFKRLDKHPECLYSKLFTVLLPTMKVMFGEPATVRILFGQIFFCGRVWLLRRVIGTYPDLHWSKVTMKKCVYGAQGIQTENGAFPKPTSYHPITEYYR